MHSNHRGLRWVVLAFIVAAAGCDGTDDGAWVRGPEPTTPTPIASAEPGPSPESAIGRASYGLDGDHPDRQYWVRCDIAPARSIDVIVAGGKVPSYPWLDRVCLGEPNAVPTPALCKEVQVFEAHAASVTSCYAKIRYLIEARSKEVLGEHWAAKVLPMIPAIWSRDLEQVRGLDSRISVGMVNLITGGNGAFSAPAAPLCFPTNGLPAELAGTVAVAKIQNLVAGVTENLDEVTSALLRGINVQVTNDLHLRLIPHFVEMPTPNIESLDCRFQMPTRFPK